MMKITEIPYSELGKYIKLAFEDDPELISKIHISPGSLEHCVEVTYSSLNDVTEYGGGYYKLVVDEKEIGFLVTAQEPKIVISFGINIHSRNGKVLSSFLSALKVHFGNSMYMVGVHSKNKRAINFFIRNDFDFFSGKDKTVYLVCPS